MEVKDPQALLELKELKVLQAQQVLKDQLDHQLRLVIITIYFQDLVKPKYVTAD